jgi:hypothetical protein
MSNSSAGRTLRVFDRRGRSRAWRAAEASGQQLQIVSDWLVLNCRDEARRIRSANQNWSLCGLIPRLPMDQ